MRILIIILFSSFHSFSQWNVYSPISTQLGIVFDFGSHKNELGLELKSSYVWGISQWQAGSRLTFSFNSYGNRKHFWESRIYVSTSILGGKRVSPEQVDPIMNTLSNNSQFRNAFGFSYLWYLDTEGTSQRSGAFGLTVDNWSIYIENDVFGGQSEDRYRTAHIITTYRKLLNRYFMGLNIWTGETRGTPWIKDRPTYCKHGFKDLSKLPYGKTSSGILYGGLQYEKGYMPILMKFGIDSEEIRHVFQNRLTHDLCWLPAWAPHNTPHYPRLDKNGFPVFSSKDRRKDLLFLQLSSGNLW